MAKKMDEWKCDETVSFEYFELSKICSLALIRAKLQLIMSRFPNKKIYIGQTVKPCGRFTNDYNTSVFPPSLSHIAVHIRELNAQLIEEGVAHSVNYERMFVICQMNTSKKIKTMEVMAISLAEVLAGGPERIANDSSGGEGPDGESDMYFLYVCVSKADYNFIP